MGFYNLDDLRNSQPLIEISEPTKPSPSNAETTKTPPRYKRQNSKEKKMQGVLPTDFCRAEGMMSVTSYVTILEDLLFKLQINVAVAKGFRDLELPDTENTKKYIDLWPIQMSAEIAAEGNGKHNVLTTNFDTCKIAYSPHGWNMLAIQPSLSVEKSSVRTLVVPPLSYHSE